MKYEKSVLLSALRQGELLSNVIESVVDVNTLSSESRDIQEKLHPFAFVISQDCDLDWDFAARRCQNDVDRLIPNVLLCEVKSAKTSAQEIVNAEGSKDSKKSRIWSRIRINKDERYHFFESIDTCHDLQEEKIGELVIDFKRYFTVPTGELYARVKHGDTQRRCRLLSPYLEHSAAALHIFRAALRFLRTT